MIIKFFLSSFYDEKVQPSTLIPKKVGYMYTVLLYAAFASLIHNKHSALEGKRVILFSYGSGLTGTMFLQLRETKNPFNLSNIARVMDVAEKLKSRQEIRSLILDVKVWEPSVINLF